MKKEKSEYEQSDAGGAATEFGAPRGGLKKSKRGARSRGRKRG